MDEKNREKEIYRVTIIGSVVNLLLLAFKFIAGIWGKSSAMIADAVHSLSDFATDVVVLFFVKVSAKPKDEGLITDMGNTKRWRQRLSGCIDYWSGAVSFGTG